MTRITATLSVLSDRVRPDQTTVILGLAPDHSVLKGSDRTPPRAMPELYGWYVTIVSSDDSTVDEVLSALLERLDTLHERIPKLREADPHLQVRFQVAVTPYSTDVSLYVDADTVASVARFGASLDIEFFDAPAIPGSAREVS